MGLWIILAGCNSVALAPSPTPPAESTLVPAGLPPTVTPTPVLPTSTPDPTSTPTAASSATAVPSPTNTPSPTPTPAPELRQLTQGGCCTQPFFSPDSQRVLFVDKPAENVPVGVYGVSLTNPAATPELVSPAIGFWNADQTIVATFEGDLVRLTNEKSGESWTIDMGGNWPRFSPDGQRVLWVATDREGPFDRRQSDVWLADLDGSNSRKLFTMFGGRSADWFPDSERILMIGRDTPQEEEVTLFIYNVDSGRRTDLFRHERIRGGEISPGGSWVAYFLSFADDPADNGLWLINTEDTSRRKLDIPAFGAFRWRDDETLLYIPFRASADESMQLWGIDAASGQLTPLTDPDQLSFSISNGDWEISPDGQQVVFVNSADQNLWLITLP